MSATAVLHWADGSDETIAIPAVRDTLDYAIAAPLRWDFGGDLQNMPPLQFRRVTFVQYQIDDDGVVHYNEVREEGDDWARGAGWSDSFDVARRKREWLEQEEARALARKKQEAKQRELRHWDTGAY
jgi:hypothetical protein